MSTERKAIAVTGGAGYLGRCMMDVLWNAGFAPVCLDNFTTGHRFTDSRFKIVDIDLTDTKRSEEIWKSLPQLSGVFHFAAKALVAESHENPAEYYRNNCFSTLNVAELAARDEIPFIHSSSCAVYGVPSQVPIQETAPFAPISPYGETKLMGEKILSHFSRSKGLRVLNLRYFNPAGALEGAAHGEAHEPETHLIPNVIRAALDGRPVSVFGSDYPTSDGSCVRDFIHVQDLVEGHLLAFQYLCEQKSGFVGALNLGSGKGASVLEVISAVEKLLDRPVQSDKLARRPGDPPQLVADISKARSVIGFEPRRDLKAILLSHINYLS